MKYSRHLATLRDTGCLVVISAVESVDDRVLARLRKGHTREDFMEVFGKFRQMGLSASRGVIRADDPKECYRAFERIKRLLLSPDVHVLREETSGSPQVEIYIEGREFALEGLLDQGHLRVLALFEKPDPLEGPFFEETIYITLSRLAEDEQKRIVEVIEQATRAMGPSTLSSD